MNNKNEIAELLEDVGGRLTAIDRKNGNKSNAVLAARVGKALASLQSDERVEEAAKPKTLSNAKAGLGKGIPQSVAGQSLDPDFLAETMGRVEEGEWVSTANQLPPTKPHSYMMRMSDKVLVRGERKNQYPWVAHMLADSKEYKSYAWGFDCDGTRYTWLSPYRDIADNQKITEWMPLPQAIHDAAQRIANPAGESK